MSENELSDEGSSIEEDEDEDLSDDESENDCRQENLQDSHSASIGGDGTDDILWTRFMPSTGSDGGTSNDELGRPTANAKKLVKQGQPLSAFRLFFDQVMVDKICKYTTAEAKRSENMKAKRFTLTPKDFDQFLGFIIGRAAFDAKQMYIQKLRCPDWGPEFFRNNIKQNKFLLTLRFLRFDDKTTRKERMKQDRLAVISEIWNRFTRNCRANYIPGSVLNLDMQLFPCHVSCKYLQQVQVETKSNENGMMFMLLVDPETKYVLHGVPYLHTQRPQIARHVTERLAMNLLLPFVETGRTVVTSDTITSVSLAESLLEKNTKLVGLTRVWRKYGGTYKNVDNLERYESAVYRSAKNFTLTTYRELAFKPVIVFSTRHPTVTISNTSTCMPDTYEFYKQNGQAVSIVQHAIRQLSTRGPRCTRWTMYLFYNLLDLCMLNAWILYQNVTESKITRRQFMFQLADELCASGQSNPSEDDVDPLSNLRENPNEVDGKVKRLRCAVRSDTRCKQHKTTVLCRFCLKHTCVACSSSIRNVCKGCFIRNRSVLCV